MDTDAFIQDLAGAARPVKPLASPETRALVWLAFGLAVIVVVMAVHGISFDELHRAMFDPRTIGEELATLATAVSAAIAAFRSTVPGADRRWVWVPFVALAAWVLLTGAGCAADYVQIGPAALDLRSDAACLPPGLIAGGIMTVVLIILLRRGAPLAPRLTLVFAGMAVAATVNLGLLVLHEGDVSIMLLVWHTGYVVALAAIGGWVAPALFGWKRRAPSRA